MKAPFTGCLSCLLAVSAVAGVFNVASVSAATAPERTRRGFAAEDDGFRVGCNYWASHAGLYMWRRWDEAVVRADFKRLAAHGMTMLRVFPLWPDFQPLTAEFGARGVFRNFAQAGASRRTAPPWTTGWSRGSAGCATWPTRTACGSSSGS